MWPRQWGLGVLQLAGSQWADTPEPVLARARQECASGMMLRVDLLFLRPEVIALVLGGTGAEVKQTWVCFFLIFFFL